MQFTQESGFRHAGDDSTQYDAARRATWPILDSGGDVIALCDLGHANNSARVRTQIVYDAYGRVIGRSNPATPATGPPELRVGHKGLFFDRLDWGIVDPLTLAETPRLEPGATLLGYNRNRTLHVGWGRFLQRDPNATGLPVQAGLGFHGDGFAASVQGFDLAAHYGDGANVYEYIGSDPLGGGDPTGLMEFSLGGQMATMAINAWEMADGMLETARIGIRSGFGLASMIELYSGGLDQAVDWQHDWHSVDYLYLASGVDPLAYGDDWSVLEADQSMTDGAFSGDARFATAGMSPRRFKEKFGGATNWKGANGTYRPRYVSIYTNTLKLARELAQRRTPGKGRPMLHTPRNHPDPRGTHYQPNTPKNKPGPDYENPHYRPPGSKFPPGSRVPPHRR
jgi:hypothetical protein